MKLSFVALLALGAIPLLVACGADTSTDDAADGDEVSESEAKTAQVTPGSFKLYAEAHASPNPSCDVHTKLDLSATSSVSKAHLEEAVGGMCEIAVIPNPRDYRLRLAGTDCGTRTYMGKYKKGSDSWSIKITDNRSRLCENVIPALIVIEETHNGSTVTKYSNDTPPGPQEGQALSLDGKLEHVMGIGGETTGYGFYTSEGMYELVLDAGEKNQFVSGQQAHVKGTLKLLSGVETHNRKAIDVTSMLVCPSAGTINCMPGPNVRLSNLCSGENRSWVQANCSGVDYVD